MSKNGYCNPVTRPDKSGKGLSHCEDRDDPTCPMQETDMSSFSYWNPAMDPDKFRELKELEWPRHVRRMKGIRVAQTCPGCGLDMSSFAYWNPVRRPDMSSLSRKMVFFMIYSSPTHSMHPP
jgi:hypothetical protein